MNHTADNGIPLLTEVLTPAAIERPPAPAPAFSVDFDIPELLVVAEAPPDTPVLPQLNEVEWDQMQAQISERITRQVLGRIDFVLEQRVRDSLADVLQVAVEGLAQEIRTGLHRTLEDVIARAVAQEILRLHKSKD
jgi:hypothetical protein